jgi:hypothetical protein
MYKIVQLKARVTATGAFFVTMNLECSNSGPSRLVIDHSFYQLFRRKKDCIIDLGPDEQASLGGRRIT